MPIIHIHSPEISGPDDALYVPSDQLAIAPLVADLALRNATLTSRPGGYVGDITPTDWNKNNASGSFWLDVHSEGEIATVNFVPYGDDSRDVDLFAPPTLDGRIANTRRFEIHDGKGMVISRPTPLGLEVGGLVMHATDSIIQRLNTSYFGNHS